MRYMIHRRILHLLGIFKFPTGFSFCRLCYSYIYTCVYIYICNMYFLYIKKNIIKVSRLFDKFEMVITNHTHTLLHFEYTDRPDQSSPRTKNNSVSPVKLQLHHSFSTSIFLFIFNSEFIYNFLSLNSNLFTSSPSPTSSTYYILSLSLYITAATET